MIVFLNGQFVPEDQARVSVFDRGFLYGDGLFETLRVYAGKPFRWAQHLDRLKRGAEFLNLRLPIPPEELKKAAEKLIQQNQMPECILRLTLSRGVGPRGYSPRGAEQPVVVMSVHPAPVIDPQNPAAWRMATSSIRVPTDATPATYKTCNKLVSVLARAEAEARDCEEALLLNTKGEVAEAAGSNLFWITGDKVNTAPPAAGLLPGVTRAVVLELCQKLNLSVRKKTILPDDLPGTDGVFLTSAVWGVVEAVALDGHSLSQSPLTVQIREAYRQTVRAELGVAG
jgi:aminodeoxychorismate lyase